MSTTAIDLSVNGAAVDALRAALRGDLVMPADAGYDTVRSIWNGMIDRRPAAIARCLGAVDVQAALRFARDHDLPVAIRSGGHNIAGLAVADDSMMIDLSAMRGVRVDPSDRRAFAQAGCILSDVDRETQAHGLAAVLGFVSTTGIAGLTLGGGFGYLTRRFGWTCDTVLSMHVVTSDGRLVRASEHENPDLFWGLRGGGGNFGIVTDIEYDLRPVGPDIVGGAIAWRWDDAADVLGFYREILASAPPEMTCVAGLRKAPPAPWIDPNVHGKPIVAFFVCHTGTPDEARADVARIKAFGSPVGDVLQRRPYVSQQTLLDATQPKGRRYYWKSEYLSDVPADLCDRLMDWTEKIPSPHGAILLFPLDGAISDLPDDYSAVGNRDAGLVLNIAAAWDHPDGDDANIEWARDAWSDLRSYSTGGVYINFQTQDEGEDRIQAAYGSNYDRLAQVKAAWDPDNLFTLNKNIAPAG